MITIQDMDLMGMQLDNGEIVHNYNLSDDYIEKLSNLSLELYTEIEINGMENLTEFFIIKFAEKNSFHNLRLLKKSGPKRNLEENFVPFSSSKKSPPDIPSWTSGETTNNVYLCFLLVNKNFIDVSLETEEENFLPNQDSISDLSLAMLQIMDQIEPNGLKIKNIQSICSNYVFNIIL